jgi:hypothetical protein
MIKRPPWEEKYNPTATTPTDDPATKPEPNPTNQNPDTHCPRLFYPNRTSSASLSSSSKHRPSRVQRGRHAPDALALGTRPGSDLDPEDDVQSTPARSAAAAAVELAVDSAAYTPKRQPRHDSSSSAVSTLVPVACDGAPAHGRGHRLSTPPARGHGASRPTRGGAAERVPVDVGVGAARRGRCPTPGRGRRTTRCRAIYPAGSSPPCIDSDFHRLPRLVQ